MWHLEQEEHNEHAIYVWIIVLVCSISIQTIIHTPTHQSHVNNIFTNWNTKYTPIAENIRNINLIVFTDGQGVIFQAEEWALPTGNPEIMMKPPLNS